MFFFHQVAKLRQYLSGYPNSLEMNLILLGNVVLQLFTGIPLYLVIFIVAKPGDDLDESVCHFI